MKDKYYEMYVNGRYVNEELHSVLCNHCGSPIFNWFYKEVESRFKYLQAYIIIDISLPEGKNGRGNRVKVDKRKDLVCEKSKPVVKFITPPDADDTEAIFLISWEDNLLLSLEQKEL